MTVSPEIVPSKIPLVPPPVILEDKGNDGPPDGGGGGKFSIEGMYRRWYLEYASYVILDRAVPYFDDGLKPVQRRILHSLWELDDSRFNKVANVIGNTMKYHPHGDAAISEAIVNMGQKDLLIETQGNWGNYVTGDQAAASRYIEARLSKFAKAVLFNPEITEWQLSYDGRNKEPIAFPVKFPILLAHGVEGIAVGLATKIMPHNFVELIEQSIRILQGKSATIFPDFPTGGVADFTDYNEGLRGGKIKVRATINVMDKKTLEITEIPFGTTTTSLIDSIISANERNKIKIRKVEDNTARDVSILIHLPVGESPHSTIDALYAFTDCETTISPNSCIVRGDRPEFLGVGTILKESVTQTKTILQKELELKLHKLQEKLHFSTLEKIFISKRIYRVIEQCESWQQVIQEVHKGLKPYEKMYFRAVTDEDIDKLTEIKMKRLSRYDSEKADEIIVQLEKDIETTKKNLKELVEFTIAYYQNLLETFGKGRERKTVIREFSAVDRKLVARANLKLYVNRKDGFVGTGLKDEEYVTDCSDMDEIIAFTAEGQFKVFKPDNKVFVGKNIIAVKTFSRSDENCVYHLIYQMKKTENIYAKRFNITSITRDKEYELTKGEKVLYFSINPSAEAETVQIELKPKKNAKNGKILEFDFTELPIQNRTVVGNVITKEPVKKIACLDRGESTLEAVEYFYDTKTRRINKDGEGRKLGSLALDDQILCIYETGAFELTPLNLDYLYGEDLVYIGKLGEKSTITAVYYDGKRKDQFVKRFEIDKTQLQKRTDFIGEHGESKLQFVSAKDKPKVHLHFAKVKGAPSVPDTVNLADLAPVRGITALGNKLASFKVRKIEAV